jgi:hypothetical protein
VEFEFLEEVEASIWPGGSAIAEGHERDRGTLWLPADAYCASARCELPVATDAGGVEQGGDRYFATILEPFATVLAAGALRGRNCPGRCRRCSR